MSCNTALPEIARHAANSSASSIPRELLSEPDGALFVRDLVHELRTPLNQIVGLTEILLGGQSHAIDSPTRGLLDLQVTAVREMSDMMDCLFDLACNGTGRDEKSPVDLSKICHDLARSISTLANRSNPVEWRIQDDMRLIGNKVHLRLIMRNLLSNAAKYSRDTSAPVVTVSCATEGGLHVIGVRDNGPGFPTTSAEKLFTPFTRLEETKHYEGLGIGLSLVKRVVELNRGTVQATGVPGQGARFFISLPTN